MTKHTQHMNLYESMQAPAAMLQQRHGHRHSPPSLAGPVASTWWLFGMVTVCGRAASVQRRVNRGFVNGAAVCERVSRIRGLYAADTDATISRP